MDTVTVDRIIREVKRYQSEWQSYKKSSFSVDLRWVQRNYAEAPNAETKEMMAKRAHYYLRLVEGYEFLTKVT